MRASGALLPRHSAGRRLAIELVRGVREVAPRAKAALAWRKSSRSLTLNLISRGGMTATHLTITGADDRFPQGSCKVVQPGSAF